MVVGYCTRRINFFEKNRWCVCVCVPTEIEQKSRERPNMHSAFQLPAKICHLARSIAASYPSRGASYQSGAHAKWRRQARCANKSPNQHRNSLPLASGVYTLRAHGHKFWPPQRPTTTLPARPHIIISATPAMAPTTPITQRTSPPAYLPKSAYTDSTIGVTHPVLSGLGGAGILPA